MEMTDKTARIRRLNDLFRATWLGGKVFFTAGVNALPAEDRMAVIDKVVRFDSFTSDNDPRGEHDFGSVEHGGHKFFWKIDYYDRELQYGSPDPSKPELTTRALTIMFVHEY